MPRRLKTMSLEQCAKRMTNFLARKPKAKTAAYVATLPKREPIKVTPLDYVACPFERAKMAAAFDPAAHAKSRAAMDARYAEWEARGKPPSPSLPPKVRKDKLRPARKPTHPINLLQMLINAQGGICFLCGSPLEIGEALEPHDQTRASFDHVLPKALGGNDRKNRLAAHRSCNTTKSDRAPFACELLFLRVANIYVDTNRANGNMGQQRRKPE